MRKQISLFLSAVFLLTGCSAKIVQNEPKPADNTVYSRDSARIRLEDDFYGYMNFDLLYGTDIPADMFEAGTLRMVQKNIDDVLSDEIISIGKNDTPYPDGSDEKRIHDIYRQYLDKDVLPSSYSEAFEQVSFQTDEEKAVQTVKAMLENDVGNIYAQKYGDEKTFAAVGDMTSDIISAYRKCIENSELLTENDRRECLAKIDNISVNIGCPDVSAYKDVQLSGNLLESVIHIKSSTVLEMLSSADKAPNADEWGMPAYDTNAAEQIADDVHSPAEIRVNGVLSSVDKFYEVYNISDSDKMFVPYDKRVRVW